MSNATEKQRQGYKNVRGIGNIDKNVPEGVMEVEGAGQSPMEQEEEREGIKDIRTVCADRQAF